MPGYVLIGHMGPGDLAPDLEGRWHAQYRLDLLGGNRTLRYGMGGAIRNLGNAAIEMCCADQKLAAAAFRLAAMTMR